jgi:hypothetical protein
MDFYTYSFEDTTCAITNPSVGSYTAYGSGLGDVTVQFDNDMSKHDVAADKTVLISKHVMYNGRIVLNVNPASEFNSWLKKLIKYLETSASSEFAKTTSVIKNNSTGDVYNISGITPLKRPDGNYKTEAEFRQYTLLAAKIEQQ